MVHIDHDGIFEIADTQERQFAQVKWTHKSGNVVTIQLLDTNMKLWLDDLHDVSVSILKMSAEDFVPVNEGLHRLL